MFPTASVMFRILQQQQKKTRKVSNGKTHFNLEFRVGVPSSRVGKRQQVAVRPHNLRDDVDDGLAHVRRHHAEVDHVLQLGEYRHQLVVV